MKRKKLGAWGERIATNHLRTKGFAICASNWRCAEGELDVVAQDGDTIVFVEVKTRKSHAYGWPEDAITSAKRQRLQRAAWHYLEAHDLTEAPYRFDVVVIDCGRSGEIKRLEHYVNAIEGEDDDPR